MGKISSRPRSMSVMRTSLLSTLKPEKLQVGPTASRPGPMLLKQHSTAEKLVPVEKPSRLRTRKLPGPLDAAAGGPGGRADDHQHQQDGFGEAGPQIKVCGGEA